MRLCGRLSKNGGKENVPRDFDNVSLKRLHVSDRGPELLHVAHLGAADVDPGGAVGDRVLRLVNFCLALVVESVHLLDLVLGEVSGDR